MCYDDIKKATLKSKEPTVKITLYTKNVSLWIYVQLEL